MHEQELHKRHLDVVKVAQHTEGWLLTEPTRAETKAFRCRCKQLQRKEDAPYRGRSWRSFVLLGAKKSAEAIVVEPNRINNDWPCCRQQGVRG